MDSRKLFVPLFACLLFLSACHSDPNLHGFNYIFENLTDKTINIKIYTNESDYNNNTNVYLEGKMDVRGYCSFPVEKFVKGQNYYADWYSDDLLYTNWYWSNITLRTAFKVSDADFKYLVNTVQYPDPSRTIWMNGLNIQTIWTANDAFTISGTNYTSVWGSMSAEQKNVQLVLNKDFSAHLKIQNAASEAIDSVLTYRANFEGNVSIITLFNMEDTVGTITSNFSPTTHTFNGDNTTMLANIRTMGNYQMARQ